MESKRATYRLTANAKANLVHIATYTEVRWGRRQRNAYLKS